MLSHRGITVFFLGLLHLSNQQFVFDKTCEYTAVALDKMEHLKFASQIFHLSGDKYEVYINFCERLQGVHANCNGKSHVCIMYKRGNKTRVLLRYITTFNGAFEIINNNKTQLILQTNPLGRCQVEDEDEDYEFKVIIDKHAVEQKITSAFQCLLEITIPHPSVAVRSCAYSHQGLVMDLNQLRQYPEQQVVADNVTTILAACRPAASCAPSASICEVDGTKKHTVAEEQHVVYDASANLITVRGKKNKVRSYIELRCNWTEAFGNPRKLLAKYKYAVDTRLGCVKMPFNCEISDVTNYVYDLSSLNRPAGWIVGNATSPMRINVCGALNNRRKSACERVHSQVCVEDGGRFVSYGALHAGLAHRGADIVLDYTHGSACPNDSSTYLSSRVLFQCHSAEVGPVLIASVNCTATILWQTPAACAIGLTPDSNFGYANVLKSLKNNADLSCTVSQDGQVFRLGSLMTSDAKFASTIRNNLTYIFNICRAIRVDARNYFCGVAGACVVDANEVDVRKRFVRVGSLVAPKFVNDEIVVHYSGGFCYDTHHRELVITINCSQNPAPLKLLNETLCRADFVLNTPLACKRKVRHTHHCKMATSNGTVVDFGHVRNSNFDVKQGNVTYNVDLCSNSINILTNDSRQVIGSINATKRLFDNQCFYTMRYDFPAENSKNASDCDSERSLRVINVNLRCDEIQNNADHLYDYTASGCVLSVDYKSSHLCALVNCNDEPAMAREVSKETIDLYTVQETQPSMATEKDNVRGTCGVSSENGFIAIDSLKPLRFVATNRNRDNFTIGEDRNGRQCAGFVCKNNRTLGTLELCPSANVVEIEGKVELLFIGPMCTNFASHKVKLIYHCTATDDVRLLKDEDCLTEILVQISERKEFCLLFSRSALMASQGINGNATNGLGYIIGSAICVVLMLAVIGVLWKIKFFSRKICCARTYVDISDSQVDAGLLHLD